jgi:outer membrane immunogenic protein
MINAKSEFDWSVAMRLFLLAAVMFGAVSTAHAADMPFLRGGFTDGLTRTTTNWQGFYVGGQGGLGTSDMDFTKATGPELQKLLFNTAILPDGGLADWPVGSPASVHGNGYGAFVGYNWQWDDIVVGMELNYMHGKFGGGQTEQQTRVFIDGTGALDNITYQAIAKVNLTDVGSLRGRAGYSMGIFLPYAFGGVALGQADIIRTARIVGTQTNQTTKQVFPIDISVTDAQNSKFVNGYVGGLGMDVMLMSCLFLRAEWEYARYTPIIPVTVNTARFGLGYKF